MSRRQMLITAAVGGLLILGVLLLVGWNRREALRHAVPEWLRPHQPPETITPELLTVSEAESFAANRCRPMAASCGDNTAGRRIRRTYPGSLTESPDSLIRVAFDISGGI